MTLLERRRALMSINTPISFSIIGNSLQNGTPNYNSPVEIISVVKPTLSNGAKSVTIPYTLRGIKNYSGVKQWYDEIKVDVDAQTVTYIQRCYQVEVPSSHWRKYTMNGLTGFCTWGGNGVLLEKTTRNQAMCNYIPSKRIGDFGGERLWMGVSDKHIYWVGCPYFDNSASDKGLSLFQEQMSINPFTVATYYTTAKTTNITSTEYGKQLLAIANRGGTLTLTSESTTNGEILIGGEI